MSLIVAIGLEPVVRSDIAALTHGRLSWMQQNYLRAETLTQANACLVDAQTFFPLAQQWGGGEVASADGLRFVVPVRTINPTATFILDLEAAPWYAPPVDLADHQEATDATNLSDCQRRLCHSYI